MSRLAPSLLAVPLLLFGYGAVRLLDPTHSPGPVWTVSHLCYLAAFPAMALAGNAVASLLTGGPAWLGPVRALLVTAGWVGALCGIGQATIDLLAGSGASDRAARAAAAEHLRELIPGSATIFYGAFPGLVQLAVVGLVALAAAKASGATRVPWWAAPLTLVAFLVPTLVSLDLIPVAAVATVPALLATYRAVRAGSPTTEREPESGGRRAR